MKILKQIDQVMARIENWLIILFLTLMFSVTFFLVMLRNLYTYGHVQWANHVLGSVDWTESFVRLLVLWITFLGASLITREGKHIKIDIMSALLPPGWFPVREMILSVGCMIVTAFMLKASISYLRTALVFGEEMFLGIPAWIGQLIIPIGFGMLFFRFALRGLDQIIELVRSSHL